ncbi:MAG: Ig-like domain-containing protein [Anaerolineales bacterium]|nr:Ig-like domain-containing protein [Anaerolineales bacterium]
MRLRRVFFLGLALSLLFVLIPLTFGQDGDQVAPPRVIETTPLAGEELALDGSVSFTFDRAMDTDSADNLFTVEPAVEGEWTWNERSNILTLTPTALERDTEYRFSVFAVDADGQAMAEAYDLSLVTIGYIEISDVIPAADTTAVDVDTDITVIFTRPIVPLVSITEQANLPSPLEITPALAGTGEWLNTSIYIYHPDDVLVGGTEYRVAVKAGLASGNGAILGEDYVFRFTTDVPKVSNMTPRDGGRGIALDTSITVSFTQPMDPATEAGIWLEGPGGVRPAVTYEWSESRRSVTLTPTALLELDSLYDIQVESDIIRSASGAAMNFDYQQSFNTVPYPAILRTDPSDGGLTDAYGGFRIYFTAPIDEETLEGKVIIDPEPWREYETYYYGYDTSFVLYFDMEPSSDYTVTILPGIADPYGNTINEQKVVNFRTRPYTPDFNLSVPDFVGSYNAYNDATRLFVNHRNISQIDFRLYELDVRDLARFTGPNGYDYRYDYEPNAEYLIRSWSAPVQSPLNLYRYELVYLSATGGSGIGNVECVGAPTSQLYVGATAQVGLTDPRPSRVRQQPTTASEIITTYEPGTTVQIQNGPICGDGYLWWEIYNEVDNVTGWMAEGTQGNYFIEPLAPLTIDDSQAPPALEPGVYFLSARAPELPEPRRPLTHAMIVANANLTMKFSPDQTLVWVTDMQSGLPIPNVLVTIHSSDFGQVASGTTDANGLMMVDTPDLTSLYTTVYAVVETDPYFGFVVSDFSQGIDPWYFEIPTDYSPVNFRGYLYTDRPLYRPDQPVYFRGVLRNRDDVLYTPMTDIDTVHVVVRDPEDYIVYEDDLPLTTFGTFSGEFTLDAEAGLGYYRIVASPFGEVDQYEYRKTFSISFGVAEYRAPEYQVNLAPVETEVAQGETIEVDVEGRYFFGSPVSNAKVEWSVIGNNFFYNRYDGPGYYSFVDYNYDSGPYDYYDTERELIASGEGTTDDQGHFMIEIPADLGEKTQSQTYIIEAVITDETDQEVASRTQVIVHQGYVYVGVAPDSYVNQANEDTGFKVISLDWLGQPVPEQSIDYRIVERRWSSVQEKDETGRTVWRWDVEEIEVSTGSTTTDAEGLGHIDFVPPNGGTFKIYTTSRDSAENLVRSSAFMWVSSREYVSWRQQNSNRVDLITDADSYEVGDTAEILIASPFQGTTYALITTERGSIMTSEVVVMESNSYVYRLPIEEIHAPNVFVSVLLTKGVDENNPYPQFRMGMAQLDVSRERLELHVEITPDIPEGVIVGPGDNVTLNVKITDWKGDPVNAEVGIGVTDLSVLTLASPNSGPLLDYFYGLQGVSVRTSTPLTVSVDQLTQTIIDTIKGGGGGGAEEGVIDIRQEFVDTPLWEPSVITTVNGEAQVVVKLPDNLTTWRIDARAVTTGLDGPMRVGQTTTDFISTIPLLIRPATPRFMIVGDKATMGAVVNNNTGTEQTVQIWMEGQGFMPAEGTELTQTVTIPVGGRVRVDWQVEVLDVPAIDVYFGVKNEDGTYQDASKSPVGIGDDQLLPVYRYAVAETVGTSGTLIGPDALSFTEIIALPARLDETRGELKIRLDRSLAGPALDGLSYLENYPHQCIEQTVSKFLPNVITMRALVALNQSNPELEANLRVQVNFGLQRLYAQQKVDGGWGWFPTDESNPLTTAYAVIGLVEAKTSNFPVEDQVLRRAVSYLNNYLLGVERRNPTAESWILNRQAFILYALARADAGNASRLTALYDLRDRLNLDARAYLTMAMHIVDARDPRIDTLISDFVTRATLSATGAHWEDRPDRYNWTTNTRTTALITMAMTQHDYTNALIPSAIRWMMVARKADAWETTQETAWAVMTLTEWMVASQELEADYEFNVRLNGDLLAIEDNTATTDNVKESEVLRIAINELLMDQANRLTMIKGEGTGNLYYTAHVTSFQYVPDVEPVSRGIIISRQYHMAGDPDKTPITQANVGDEIVVTLTIIAPRNLHYVVIEDPIPAGTEAINRNLLTTSQIGQRPTLNRDDPFGRGWGWWWFSRTEMRDEKLVMYSTYLPRGTYTYVYSIRASFEGEYNVIPTTGQEFYFPEVYGRGAGNLFIVNPAEE